MNTSADAFYGACGTGHCGQCWPLHDEQNRVIPGTETGDGVIAYLVSTGLLKEEATDIAYGLPE